MKEAGQDVKSWKLKNDGSLFSAEVHELSEGYDVVVTNPPFSGMHSILRFISDRDLDYAVIAPFFTIQTLVEEHSKPTRIYYLSSNEFIIPDAEAYRFSGAAPYSLDSSRGLAVNIC